MDGFVKKPDICVTLHPLSLQRITNTPGSSGVASLDLELYKAVSVSYVSEE
jgi:hypothetical protein